jgi:hypothetical protein
VNPTEAFEHARDALLQNADDLERARAAFSWPELTELNWAARVVDLLLLGVTARKPTRQSRRARG